MNATTLVLDAALDPGRAEVLVRREGGLAQARFAMTGMPRVESLLIGRPVRSVPTLVERLCGICPASHHLAGIRALESALGIAESSLPAGAIAVRRLLHHASVLEAHAGRLSWVEPGLGSALGRLARRAQQSAGGPGHFPVCAVPGGVRSPVAVEDAAELVSGVDEWLPALTDLCHGLLATEATTAAATLPAWTGVDVALVAEDGDPDLLGVRLRVVDAGGHPTMDLAPDAWDESVAEAAPGSATPRPYIVALGAVGGRIRVGPIAHLRVGPLTTSLARAAQERWLAGPRTATVARAIVALHCAEVLAALAADPALTEGAVGPVGDLGDAAPTRPPSGRVGTGWIDGQRGLLSHSYRSDDSGMLVGAQILTPTASNEAWLGDLLSRALSAGHAPAELHDALEAAIREADPCLPCTSTPPGAMTVTIREGT